MNALATRFRVIMDGLRAAIGAHLARDRSREAAFTLVWSYLGRLTRRFERLFDNWQSGTLPRPRPSRAGVQRKPADRKPRLPRGRTWVVAAIGYQAAGHAGQLQHLLADPDIEKFLRDVPQAGRLLRPLCAMLGITASPDVPAVLALPPPPRFRPAPPSPPPYLGIIDPPEVAPFYLTWPRNRAGRAWSV